MSVTGPHVLVTGSTRGIGAAITTALAGRGARVIVVTDASDEDIKGIATQGLIQVPFVSHELSPILLNIPLQLLAYHVAVLNGTDVDLPRNLAKSVTVE